MVTSVQDGRTDTLPAPPRWTVLTPYRLTVTPTMIRGSVLAPSGIENPSASLGGCRHNPLRPGPTLSVLVANDAAPHIRRLLSQFRERIVWTTLERNSN